jgi:arginase family enzyme
MPISSPKKLFGVALDPADDPFSLQLKQAWMAAEPEQLDWLTACLDPYDAVTRGLAAVLEKQSIKMAGKFPVPSWLWPKPKPSDWPVVNAENMRSVTDSGYLLEIIKQLQSFVTANIFPGIPVMLGVDHSATAGVVSALAERYGPENLTVVVLDQHFDAIPLSVRLKRVSQAGSNPTAMPLPAHIIPIGFTDTFCCGNFWPYLMDKGLVLPENLIFIGVADYPAGQKPDSEDDDFRKSYLDFEKRGCSFFPLRLFDERYTNRLTRFLRKKIKTDYVYVSLDLDVGAFAGTYAARYMDRPGISREQLLDVAGAIAAGRRRGRYELAGLDVMEFNMHFLGIETPDGVKDGTLELVGDYITALT